ncbi:type II toxin-antitoxin system RelB/DinJ family antitoxin [Desulfovibrio sp. ZJ200]|uniref:type II toxin-antitoxin system RelB/DinJ family antitoxin n=1 Tax=Desulfovibrio sp. ZJ200 TaxID=2709792 RepID=UPI0013EC429D|nr:type II toxin-antitoxin system RelB/DinJ family antitoxin [Desulfovibrio sp. ZJ200]
MATTSMNIRMDSTIKRQAQELFATLGMDMTTAVNIFLRQSIRRQGLPFDVALNRPNRETLEAIAEVREMKKHPERYKGYTDVDAMMKDMLA